MPGDSFSEIGAPNDELILEQYRSSRFETALMRTSRRIRRVYDAGLREVDLNLTEVNLLVMVYEHGPMSQTKLAENYGIGRARAGAVVDKLESRGLLKRVPDELDRRVWLVESTPLATELVSKINSIDASIRADLRDGMSRTDRIAFARLLRSLSDNLSYLEERLGE
ncbi:hypothetical protein A5695_06625 [Mycobacterium sp. E1747]|nr:hypothetical protein A5695_06625 [Mycobacterium sp. E1747]